MQDQTCVPLAVGWRLKPLHHPLIHKCIFVFSCGNSNTHTQSVSNWSVFHISPDIPSCLLFMQCGRWRDIWPLRIRRAAARGPDHAPDQADAGGSPLPPSEQLGPLRPQGIQTHPTKVNLFLTVYSTHHRLNLTRVFPFSKCSKS